MQNAQNPTTRPARIALLIFLIISGPIAALIGFITNNTLLISTIPTICIDFVAILSVSIFEDIITGGIHHVGDFFVNILKLIWWLIKTLFANSILAYIILCTVLAVVLTIPHITPEIHAKACLQPPLHLLCGDGLGITQITVDNNGQVSQNGSTLNIGVIDPKEVTGNNTPTTPFDQYEATNITEKNLEDRISNENHYADTASKHFTLAVMTTLSHTVTDNGFSASVGLEDLRGAYLAQYYYNHDNTDTIKLHLIIANMGVKFALPTTGPLVAQQLALFAMNAPEQTNFMGVTSLPFSNSVVATLSTFQQYGIPVVSSSASSNLLSDKAGFYRIEPPDSKQNPYIVQFIQLLPQHDVVAVVYDPNYSGSPDHPEDAYSQSLGRSIFDGLTGANIAVSSYSYRVGHPETIPLQAILNDKPDLLFFAGYPDDLSALKDQLKELQRQNIIIPKMSIMGAQALYELGGYSNDNYANLYFTSFGYPNAQVLKAQMTKDLQAQVTFADEYTKQFNQNGQHTNEYGFDRSTPHSALSYDAVTAFQQAVKNAYMHNAQNLTLTSVKAELAIVSFYGATGKTTFNGNDSSSPSDPTVDKPLYFLCVNPYGLTKKITAIISDKLTNPPNLDTCKK